MGSTNTPSQDKTNAPALLPDGIEIFRAGRHTDDAGQVHAFSEADIASIAASYNPALREAPLTVGHPAHDLPAYGWVRGLQAQGGHLLMATHQVEPQFAEMVQAGRFKKRSAAFYPPTHPNNPTPGQWYVRHVAFLGAQPPAVAGLKDIQFAEADAVGTVNFSEATHSPHQENPMDKELQAQLDAANQKAADEQAAREKAEKEAKAAKEQLAQFAEAAREQRHAGHISFAEAEVKSGRLLPKDAGAAVAVLDLLADATPVEFSEGDATKKVVPAEWLKGLISAAKPVVSFGEHAMGGAGRVATPKSDAEIDAAAKQYAAQHNVSYAEALNKVVSFTA